MSTYGYNLYDTGYYWQGKTGPTSTQNYYGVQLYSQFDVSPFTAVARDYETIMLTWSQPQGTMYGFRLVANRYGFPVDQNDGDVLISSATYPGSIYADQNVIPGSYHYYGIYIQVTNTPPVVWQRCAFASVLAPENEATGPRMYNLLPTYFREALNGDLTTDAAGNQYLAQFLDVIGWGFDYIKTQYDVLYQHLNDPLAIPLGDLVNLAAELGMPFQPELPAHIMRKALANWTHVCRERGTPGGISEHITLLTGYPVDLQTGRNKMLENDQAQPLHPTPPAWSASISYVLNELVSFGNYIYKCIQATTNLGNAPTGSTSANTWWTVQQNVTDPASTLANPGTVGGVNTWQALYPALDSGGTYATPAGSLVTTIGLADPLAGTNFQHNAFSVFNKSGTTQDIMLRSVSQITTDRTGTNTNMTPDPLQAVKDGLPIPRLNTTTNGWVPTTRYATNAIVLWNGVLYQALRASTNAMPPNAGTPLNANPNFETAVTPWTGINGATVAQSASQAFQGSDSMLVTPNGTTAAPGAQSEAVTVIPGAQYIVSSWVFMGTGASVQAQLNWYDPYGVFISQVLSSSVTPSASTWTQLTLNGQAPGNAATARIVVGYTGTPSAATTSFWDAVTLACWQTPEWEVLSRDNRIRMMMSGYCDGPSGTVQVVPFVEWYDESGNLIVSNGQARVFARTATPGTPGVTPNLTFDSFTLGTGTYLTGRQTDSKDQQWVSQTGLFTVSGFSGGSVYPAVSGTRSVATVTGLSGTTGAPIWLGVTFGSTVPSGTDSGIVFRMASLTSYWRAGMTGLYTITSGVATLVGNYSTPCQPGDRLVVALNGNTVTVFRNGSQVLTTTNSMNATATIHGIAVEAVGI